MGACSNCGHTLDDSAKACPVCATAVTPDGRTQPDSERAAPPLDAETELALALQGQVLEGKWQVERPLGKGAMGIVMLAHDLALDRKVAIKLLADYLCSDHESVSRFEREARLTAKLDHPNIVAVHAVGRHEHRPFIVMKYLDGMPLSSYLRAKTGRMSSAEVLSLMRQLCAGLELIHREGYVHRDIKPSNIFLSPSGHATILDFGIHRGPNMDTTFTGVIGTANYMSPEQVRSQRVDHRTDLYALGVVLFQVLAGRLPFQAGNDRAVRELHLTQPPPDVTEIAPSVPRAVGDVVRRALAKNPDERFQSAREMMDALEAAFRLSMERPDPLRPASPPSRRRALLGAGAILAVVVGAYALLRSPSAAPPPRPAVVAAPPVQAPGEPSASAVTPSAPPPAAPIAVSRPEPAPARPVQRPRRPAATPNPPAAPLPGQLRVVTVHAGQPTWATLILDGKRQGGTPLSIEVPAGTHQVRVERTGFTSVERQVTVSPGELSTMRIELQP